MRYIQQLDENGAWQDGFKRRAKVVPLGGTLTMFPGFNRRVHIAEAESESEAAAEMRLVPFVEPVPAAPVVPAEIANWRAKAVLSLNGKLDDVEAAIEAMEEPTRTAVRFAWGAAPLQRNGTTVLAIAQLIGMDSAAVDALFIQADALLSD